MGRIKSRGSPASVDSTLGFGGFRWTSNSGTLTNAALQDFKTKMTSGPEALETCKKQRWTASLTNSLIGYLHSCFGYPLCCVWTDSDVCCKPSSRRRVAPPCSPHNLISPVEWWFDPHYIECCDETIHKTLVNQPSKATIPGRELKSSNALIASIPIPSNPTNHASHIYIYIYQYVINIIIKWWLLSNSVINIISNVIIYIVIMMIIDHCWRLWLVTTLVKAIVNQPRF